MPQIYGQGVDEKPEPLRSEGGALRTSEVSSVATVSEQMLHELRRIRRALAIAFEIGMSQMDYDD